MTRFVSPIFWVAGLRLPICFLSDGARLASPATLSPDSYYDRLPPDANLAQDDQDDFAQGELVLTVQGFVADPFGRRVRRRYKAALRGSLGFTAFSSSVAALGSADTRHQQQASQSEDTCKEDC